MAVTVTNGFGPMPLTMHVLLSTRLRNLARREWEREVRPTLNVVRRVFNMGRDAYTASKETEWMATGECPYLRVSVTPEHVTLRTSKIVS